MKLEGSRMMLECQAVQFRRSIALGESECLWVLPSTTIKNCRYRDWSSSVPHEISPRASLLIFLKIDSINADLTELFVNLLSVGALDDSTSGPFCCIDYWLIIKTHTDSEKNRALLCGRFIENLERSENAVFVVSAWSTFESDLFIYSSQNFYDYTRAIQSLCH